MSLLEIEFHGICVFFSMASNPELNLPTAFRVVVPFVPEPFTWNGETIYVHEPHMSIEHEEVVEMIDPLGTTITLGPLDAQPFVQGMQECPPHLPSIFPAMTLNLDVVTGQMPPAGFYFDFNQGSLIDINVQGAAATLLTIDTSSTTAGLTIDRWGGGHESKSIPLPARILVSNTAKDPTSDFDFDFIVSYAVGLPFPPPDSIAEPLNAALEQTLICSGPSPSQDLGPGCSNSQFP